MNYRTLAIGMFVLALVVASVYIDQTNAVAQDKASVSQKWEYKIVVQQDLNQEAIADLGEEGWEIVTVSVGSQYVKESEVQPDRPFKGHQRTTNSVGYGRSVFVMKRAR